MDAPVRGSGWRGGDQPGSTRPEPDLPAGDVRRAAHARRRPCRPGRHAGAAADRMAEAAPAPGRSPTGSTTAPRSAPVASASTNSPRSKAATSTAPCTWPGDGSRHQRSLAERRSHFCVQAARAHRWAAHPDQAIVVLWQARRAALQHMQPSRQRNRPGPHSPHAPPPGAPAPARSMARPHLLGDINPRATSDAGPGSAGYRPEPHACQIPDWARHGVAATTDRSQIPSPASS